VRNIVDNEWYKLIKLKMVIPVPAGHELLADYGAMYWSHIPHSDVDESDDDDVDESESSDDTSSSEDEVEEEKAKRTRRKSKRKSKSAKKKSKKKKKKKKKPKTKKKQKGHSTDGQQRTGDTIHEQRVALLKTYQSIFPSRLISLIADYTGQPIIPEDRASNFAFKTQTPVPVNSIPVPMRYSYSLSGRKGASAGKDEDTGTYFIVVSECVELY
jgi:hypothetical protein